MANAEPATPPLLSGHWMKPLEDSDVTVAHDRATDASAPVSRAAQARSDLAVIRDLVPWLRPYRWRIGLAMGLVVLAKLVNLYVPVVMKQLVDGLNVEPSL